MLHIPTISESHIDLMLGIALIFVLIYEAINGFHDTANAVATLIYTRAMHSKLAVIMSGIFNFFGVLMGGLSVAYSIVHLLPTDLLLNINSSQGLAMIFSMLMAAIIWNLGTWYLGLPASSSHTLIGAVIGAGITNALVSNNSIIQALNVPKLFEIFLLLIISPVVGLVLAGIIIFIIRHFWKGNIKQNRIHLTPEIREKKDGKCTPPLWTRIGLIFSAAGVSFSHGANDGQKGIGLIMLILIGIAPDGFIVNMNANSDNINRTRDAIQHLLKYYMQHRNILIHVSTNNALIDNYIPKNTPFVPYNAINISDPKSIGNNLVQPQQHFHCDLKQAIFTINQAVLLFNNLDNYKKLNVDQRSYAWRLLVCIADITNKVAQLPEISSADKRFLLILRKDLLYTVEYAPIWIIFSVALALSLGTMIGWRRVTSTIGENIGKKSMTYAQGLSAQITTALSIGIASYTGMPVSTTHVLSSSLAGAMLIDGSGVQIRTIKNILLAWILTLPMAIILASSLYWFVLKLI